MEAGRPEEVPEAGVNALAVDDEVSYLKAQRRRLNVWYQLLVCTMLLPRINGDKTVRNSAGSEAVLGLGLD